MTSDITESRLVTTESQVMTARAWIDYAAAALFAGLIFFDINRAMQLPRTMDNAVDCAVALYLDIFNLFIRLLSILGKAKRS